MEFLPPLDLWIAMDAWMICGAFLRLVGTIDRIIDLAQAKY
jgi:hypothetical protein